MKSAIIQSLRVSQTALRGLVETIDPADYAATPKTDKGLALNPAAWQLPHIAMSLSHTVAMLTGKQTISEDWLKRFAMGSVPSVHAEDYPTKEEALAAVDKSIDALIAALENATDAQLAAPTPVEQLRRVAPTIGDVVVFLGVTHTAMHAGQLMTWRRCMGFAPRF